MASLSTSDELKDIQKKLDKTREELKEIQQQNNALKKKSKILKPWMWCRIKLANGSWSDHGPSSTFSNNWHVAHL